MKKTFFTSVLALLASMSAWAQNSFTVNGLNYLETGVGTGKVKITGYTTRPTGVLDIPETVSPSSGGSYTVTEIADEVFSECSGLTELVFPESLRTIGAHAFHYCQDLTSITCYNTTPPNVGEGAFEGADKTIPVYVPANALSSYRSNANWSVFTRTTYITFISNNLEYKLLYTSPNQAEIIGYTTTPTGVLNIPATVNHKGKDYTIITIAEEVFSECSGLTELVFSESLGTIGAHAFHYCQDLTSITCYNTTPPNVGEGAFEGADKTIPVYVPANALSSYQSNADWSVFTNLQAIVTEFTVGGLTYEVIDQTAKTVEVKSSTDELPSTVTIPPTVSYGGKNYTVTAIASSAFYQNQTITAITIFEGITSIGNNTFGRCFALTTVNIPASLTQMGDWVFDNCSALTAINVAGSNTAYYSVNGILFNKDKTTLICYPAGKPQLEYTIPSSVTVIGVNAFAYCDALTQLTIPSSVTSIGEWAFDGCTALAEMTVLATVPPTVADADVFRNVDCNIPVYVPAASLTAYQAAEVWKDFNLQAIAVNEFTVGGLTYEVTDQTAKTVDVTDFTDELPSTVTIPATVSYGGVTYTVTAIASEAFDKNETITEITISEGITSIGDYTFNKCVALTTVNIPARLTYMGEYVFDGCTSLTQINVDEANTAYCSENGVLFNKDKTTLLCYPAGKPETDYTIPSSVTVIGKNAFSYCAALTTLTIPAGVTTIESYAFYDCPGFTKMTVLATVPPTIADEDVFYNVNRNIPVYVPAESLTAYQNAEVWKEFNLQAIAVNEFTVGGLTYEVIDQTAKTVEVINFTNELPNTATIPATVSYESENYTVTSIASEAFSQNETITEITISEGITSIGDNTFSQCYALTAVNIPASLTNIGDWVFDACTALTQINVASGNTAYCSENGILFNKDKTTLICYPAGKQETDYTIPSSVTVIGKNAFSNCAAITTLTIPAGVTIIEDYAFYFCTALAEMTVLATVPPTITDEGVFYCVDNNIPVYVPAASLAAYQAAEVWKEFNLQAISGSAVTNPSMPESISMQNGTLHNPQQLHLTLYDMQGRQVYSGNDATVSQPAGVYVVRCNGASGKIVF